MSVVPHCARPPRTEPEAPCPAEQEPGRLLLRMAVPFWLAGAGAEAVVIDFEYHLGEDQRSHSRCLEPGGLHLSPDCNFLASCVLGHIVYPLCDSVYSSLKWGINQRYQLLPGIMSFHF